MNAARRQRRAGEIFAVPALLALVSLAGLIFALLVDGPPDAIAWIGIGAPVAVILWALLRRKARTP